MTPRLLGTALLGASVATLVPNAYLALLTGAAAVRRPATRSGTPRGPIAVLVPAHDEEVVIERTLAALLDARQPVAGATINVVADHCTDRTISLARALGVHVLENTDPARRGKGPALQWAVELLAGADEPPSIVAVIDADTLVSADFLLAVEAAFAAGATAVQGRYSVSNRDDSPVAALRDVALALRHLVRPLGRARLGGSCGLFGNGMAFELGVLRSHPFTSHLTEDAELACDLVLDGTRVTFSPDAAVAAEMPIRLEAAVTQHERWEQGRLDVTRRYLPRLVRRAVTGPHRWMAADAAFDLAVPPLSVVALATAGNAAVAATAAVLVPGRRSRALALAGTASTLLLAAHIGGGMRLAGVRVPARALLVDAPRVVVWKGALWARVALGRRDVQWTRTRRVEEGAA